MVLQEAVAVVKEVEDPEESTKKLVGEAIRRGSADNITCVVVRFLESKSANNKASRISSTHANSSQEANQGKTAVRNDSDHKISAKETNQDHTAAHSDLDRNAESENLNQKPIAARSNDSGPISLTKKPIAITAAAGRSVSSEQSGSASQKNQMPIAIRSGSEAKSSAKQPGQEQITVHNDLDRSIANQKQKIAATHATSSEQSGSTGEKKNRKPIAVHSDSATSKSSSVHSIAN